MDTVDQWAELQTQSRVLLQFQRRRESIFLIKTFGLFLFNALVSDFFCVKEKRSRVELKLPESFKNKSNMNAV